MYETHNLKTGAQVSLRPLPYEDWSDIEELRFAQVEQAVELVEAGKKDRANLVMLRLNSDIRQRKLGAALEKPGEVLPTLSVPEVREVEAIIDRITFAEVTPENLSDAGAGPATASE